MNYREVKAINNSLMSVYEDDYLQFVAHWVGNQPLPEYGDDSLTMGSLVDTLLTRPEDWDTKYIRYDGISPDKPQMLKFCTKLAQCADPILPLESCYEVAYNRVGIKSPKFEGFIANFEPYKDYVQFLIDSPGKQVVTKEQQDKAKLLVTQLSNNQYTKDIVNAKSTSTGEVFNQLELYYEYANKGYVNTREIKIRMKGAIDRVLVSHKNKTIRPIDFKTSHNVLDFRGSYVKYRYYRQGSYYTMLLTLWAKEQGWADYEILPFQFVVCSTSGGSHWNYIMSERDIHIAQIGGETTWGYKIKGWQEILDEIVYCTEKREWNYPYECQVNNGVMDLNIFK